MDLTILIIILIILIFIVLLYQINQTNKLFGCFSNLKDEYVSGIGKIKTYNTEYIQEIQKMNMLGTQPITKEEVVDDETDKKLCSNFYMSDGTKQEEQFTFEIDPEIKNAKADVIVVDDDHESSHIENK